MVWEEMWQRNSKFLWDTDPGYAIAVLIRQSPLAYMGHPMIEKVKTGGMKL